MSRIRNLSRPGKSARRPRRTAKIHLEQLEGRLAPSVNVLSYDYGNTGTTGANTGETQLTPANVNSSDFGKLYKTLLDGQVYAEPLVDQNVTIGASGGDAAVNLVGPTGTHNVVIVATEHDSLYAIDSGSGVILWKRNFTDITTAGYSGSTPGTNINNTLGASAISTVPAGDTASNNISPEIGITSTPVIDPDSGTIYVLVKTKETFGGVPNYVQRLHGINLGDGTDRIAPFVVGTTNNNDNSNFNDNTTPIFVYGTGDGNVHDPNAASDGNPGTTIVQFNALREAQRPGLSFENGQVYVAWASHGDNSPYHGWVVTWKVAPSGFQLAGWFCSSPNDGLSGIWAGGGAIQFEPDGSAFYFETGNGSGGNPTLNAQGFPTNANYNEALVKMVADPTTSVNAQGPNGWGMKVADYFIPYNVAALDAADADFGSGAPLLLPPSAGIPGHPNLILAAGKSGEIYLIDRNNMGKFDPVNDNVVNAVNDGTGHLEPPNLISGSLSTAAYYNGKIYWVSGYSGSAYSYQISSSGIISPASQSTNQFGFEPGSIEVSGNGAVNGIAWVMDRSLTEIHAYDASTFATELWNSNEKAGGGDSLDSVVLFAAPTEANGEVFVGTLDSLTVYGLNQAPSAVPNQPTLSAAALSGSSINLTWTDTSTAPNTATTYAVEESTDNMTFSAVATTPAGATSVAIGGLAPTTTYYFRIRGQDALGYSPYSNVANATTTNEVPGLDFSSGFGSSGTQSQFTMNGSALFNGTNLELTTSGMTNEAASAFVTAPVDVTSFQTQFSFQSTNSASSAEGFTFTFQNAAATALGASGAALGYGPQQGGGNAGIGNSVAIKFDLNSNNGEGPDSTGLYIDGAAPTSVNSIDLSSTGINLHDGDVFRVNMNYDGTTLTVTLTDTVTSAFVTETYPIGIPGTIGSTTAYVGFTASTGTQTATQDILNWTYTPTAASSPNAPSGLGAVAASANSVFLDWTTNSSNQTSFNLDRATDSAFTQNRITLNLPATPSSFTDTAAGLAPGGTYYYRLRAFNSAGDSGNSNVASVTIPVPPPPPTNPQVVDVTSSEIDLQWQDNAGHNTQGYHIYRATNHGSFTLVANLPPTSRTAPDPYGYDDITVSPGTFYEYQIDCYDVSGNNGFVDISTTSLTVPPNLVYVQLSGNSAKLYFTASAGATSYNIYRGTASGAETLLASHVNGSPYIDSPVMTGTTYFYYVTAVNANVAPLPNESVPSNESSPTSTSGTFQWTGGGSDANWATAANWMGGKIPTGNGNETLIFPGSAAQPANVDNLPAGSDAFSALVFSGSGYSVTLDSPLAVGSGGISEQNAGSNTFNGTPAIGLFLVANQSFTAVSGATLIVNAPIDLAGSTLTVAGAGNVSLAGLLSDSGGLTVSGTATLSLSGANSFTGAIVIGSGTIVNVLNGAALGTNNPLTLNGILNAVPVAGLPGTYYNTAAAADPVDAIGIPATASPANLLAFAATLPIIATDNSANFPQAGPDNWNQNGKYFDYSEDGNGANTGFPATVQTVTGGLNFLAIWSGQFDAPVTGEYDFGTSSDDGSAIYVDGNLVVDNNSYQPMTFRDSNNPLDPAATTAPILTAGVHSIIIAYYQGTGGYGLFANVTGPAGSGLTGHLLNASLSPAFLSAVQLSALTGTGTLNLGPTTLSIGSSNASTTFGGNITGFGNITKLGTGALTLGAAEAFTGNWIVSAGQLVLGTTASPIGGESMTSIANNTTNNLVINNPGGNTFTLNAAISGTAGLTLNGTGTYALAGNSSYTGPTSIPAGATVSVSGTSPLGNGDVTLPTGATLILPTHDNPGTGLPGQYWTFGGPGSASDPKNFVGSLSTLLPYIASLGTPFVTDITATNNGANSNGTVVDYGSGTSGTVSPGFPAVLQSAPLNGKNFVGVWQGYFYAPTAGSYGFDTSSDDGSMIFIDGLTVVSNNFYQGPAKRSGTINLAAGPHTIVLAYYNGAGGYAFYADVEVPGATSFVRIANSLLGTQGPITVSLGSLSGGGTITLNDNSLNVGGDNNPSTTFSGSMSGTGGLVKAGTGTMILSKAGNLTFMGSSTIAAGTLQIGDGSQALGTTLAIGGIVDNGTLVLDGPTGSNLTYNGNISGPGGLTQVGTWTLTLGGNSSYTGPTVIPSGSTVNATSGHALGNNDFNLVSGATLNVLAAGNPAFGLGTGLAGQYFTLPAGTALPPAGLTSVAGIAALEAAGTLVTSDTSAFTTTNTQGQVNTNNNGATFNYGTGSTANKGTSTSGFPTAAKTINTNGRSFMGVWTGVFFATTAGTYQFDTASDDGTTLFIDGTLIVSNNFTQPVTTRSGTSGTLPNPVNLSAGPHTIEIAYYNGGGNYGLWADVLLPGTASFQRLPNALMGQTSPTLLQLNSLSGAGTINLAANSTTANNGLYVGIDNNSTTFTGTINAPGLTTPGILNLLKGGAGIFILANGASYRGDTGISGGVLQLGTADSPLSTLPTSNIVNNANLTLFLPAAANLIYNGVISGSGAVTFQGSGSTLSLGGVNTYAGPTSLGANTVKQLTTNALPKNSTFTLGAGFGNGVIDLNGFSGGIGGVSGVSLGTGSAVTNSSATPATLTITNAGLDVNINVLITGPLSLTISGLGSETLSVADTYTGSTTITGSTVIAANSAAVPNGTALTISTAGILDLNGHNLTVASLTGVGVGNALINSSATSATLTITGSSGGFFNGAISGLLSIVDASSAATTLTDLAGSGNSTFSGGVTATSGIVGGVPGSFGVGPVTFNGGSVALDASQAVTGFNGNGTGWKINTLAADVNGAGTFTAPDVFKLTSSDNNEAASIFDVTPVQPDAGFTSTFTYQDLNSANTAPADGVMFILQSSAAGPAALGGAGGGMGYSGIPNSMAIALNLYTGAAGGRGTALQSAGSIATTINPNGSFSMLTTGHLLDIVITYNASAQVLVETIADETTGITGFANFYSVNLASLLGSTNAFIGFSGGTGGLNAGQQISKFSYLGASGAQTAFTNNLQASAGTTSNLTVNTTSLASAYPTNGNFTVPTGSPTTTVNLGVDSTSMSNQPYSLTVGGTTTLGGNVNVANNGTGTGTLILAGPVQGAGAGGTTIGSIGGTGNVVLASTSTYKEVLGGSSQPGGWDNLGVSGPLNLAGGNLSVSLANGFSPSLGQSFTILHSTGPLTGTFAQGNTITAGNITYSIAYNPNSVVLTPIVLVTPTQLVVTAPSTGTAGTPITVTIAATDSSGNTAGGYTGTVTLTGSKGGISPTSVMLVNGSATLPITLTKSGSQTITAASTGSPLLASATSGPIVISPGAFSQYKVPLATGGPTIAAGNTFLISVQATDANGNTVPSYAGPASVTVSSSPSAAGFPTTVMLDNTGLGSTLATLTAPGTYTITAASGAFTGSAAALTVVPGAAAKLGFVAQPGNTPTGNALAPVTVQVQDLYGNPITSDNTDQVTLRIVSGPGPFTAGSSTTATVHNGLASFASLVLAAPGTYVLSAIVPALYTGPDSASFTVTPLQVLPTSFASSPSGFSLAFNAPILVNSTTPVLYGPGFGLTALVPSVTLTQTKDGSGNPIPPVAVAGSVVLTTATNSLTFVATNTTSEFNNGTPILTDGTYVVDLTSSAARDGFQAINRGGGFLDGLSSGTPGSGDFKATFTVNAAAAHDDVLWVPATADGPGQALSAPGRNQLGGGYPIYLQDAAGAVTSVSATLTYNPALLTVTSGSGGPGFTVTVSTLGTATLTYSGPALAAGSAVPIGYLGWSGALNPAILLSGGALTTGTTYYYEITSTNGTLESPGSLPVSATPSASNRSAMLTWPQDPVAAGYKLYRTTTLSAGVPVFGASSLLTTISGGATTTFTDTGSTPSAGTPPSTAGFSTAIVPAGTTATPTPYRAKDVLHLAGVSVNGNAIPAVGGDALHLVAYVGDADGNGGYGSNDAVLITRAALSTDSGFAAYPLVDPVIVGDTDGQGFIPSDASLQANEAGVGQATLTLSIPPIPLGVHFAPIANNVDPTVSLPATLQVGTNGTVTVPVNIDDAHPEGSTGLIEAHLALRYNPRLFTVSAADVHPGSALAGGDWSVVPMIDQATGEIGIALSSSTPISASIGGSLVTIDFHQVAHGEPGGVSPRSMAIIALVASVNPDGQYVTTELEDAQGTFTLTPAPGNGFDSRIDGVVTLTATSRTAGVIISGADTTGQHLADLLFQSLVRGVTNASDPQLPCMVKDVDARVLADQLIRPSSLADDLDRMNWDDMIADWDGRDPGSSAVAAALRARRELRVNEQPIGPMAEPVAPGRAVLDQYFAQAADDADRVTDND